jgi:DNA-directed RNA polymerase specialized sigma24 family protein
MSKTDPLIEATRSEHLGILHQELSCLAEKYRAPLVLCYLEDRTQDEAARQLAWGQRTLRRRRTTGPSSRRTCAARSYGRPRRRWART